VIVVDDGSTDDTSAVLQRYGDRIVALQQPNRGPAVARNRGIAAARGEWVAFLDSDDMWEPGTLQRLLEAARHNPDAGLITVRGRVMTSDGRRTDKIIGKQSPGPEFTPQSFLGEDSGGVLTPMVRRDLLQRVGGYDETLSTAEDCDLWLRLSFQTRMVAVDEPLLLRRIHGENFSDDQHLNARMWLRILDKLQLQQPEFVRRHQRLFRRSLAKEHLRLGRECLARAAAGPEMLAAARANLKRSLSFRRFSRRAWIYLAWSYLAPSTFVSWRRREQQLRQRRHA
jgi:glycosyltransferase involved in cell wall biosynthesis